ncbi:MAG TPA: hypothetical protein PK500_01610 [Candidatus Egerieousia sp.]|nr:hypothetical protein [Candidatus Egerieousia sp.]HPT05336.1 hypothetical protein [Candidatus Egerieousia sp.]
MKNLFWIFSVLSFCLLFGCSKQPDVPITKDKDVIYDGTFTGYVYKFRNLKNKEVWKTFENGAEVLAACQIPQDSLNRLNTEGLSQSCMFLPISFTYSAYYSNTVSHYDGILSLIKSCNCLTALTSKDLAPVALIKLYKNMVLTNETFTSSDFIYSLNIFEKNSSIDKDYLELLLSTEYFTPKMDLGQLKELAKEIQNKITFQVNCHSVSYAGSICYTYTAGARVVLRYDSLNPFLTQAEKDKLLNFINRAGDDMSIAQQECISLVDSTLNILAK